MTIKHSSRLVGDVLYVKATGQDDDLESVQRYGQALIAEAMAAGCRDVLVDETELVYSLGVLDTYELARFLSESAPLLARVAIVYKSEQHADAAFWETVAVNRGLMVRIFPSVAEAETWMAS
jgi:hypothetical protein